MNSATFSVRFTFSDPLTLSQKKALEVDILSVIKHSIEIDGLAPEGSGYIKTLQVMLHGQKHFVGVDLESGESL